MIVTSRVAVMLLPADPERPPEDAAAVLDRWRAAGFLAGDRPGPRPLVPGGFARVRADLGDRVRFVANGMGGFRVYCPDTGANVVPSFDRALEAWRAGGPRALACTCGALHDLAALDYRPPAGFARGWIAVEDAAAVDIDPAALAEAEACLGEVRIVLRRG